MKFSTIFALIAALGLAGAALADDSVKSGGPTDKPGRTLDQDSAGKPGDDKSTVKSGGQTNRPGRKLEKNN